MEEMNEETPENTFEGAVQAVTNTAGEQTKKKALESATKAKDTAAGIEVNGQSTTAIVQQAQTGSVDFAKQTQSYFSTLDFANPSWDLFVVLFFIVGALLYGLSLGKERIIAIMVSIYMALAVITVLPDFVFNVKINDQVNFQVTAFLAVFVVLFFLLSRRAVFASLAPTLDGSWWQVILFSFLHVGLLVSVTLSFLPAHILSNFSPFMQNLFTAPWPKFAWVIAPIVMMAVIGRSKDEE